MTTMGELLASARRSDTFQLWLAGASPALSGELLAAAAACSETPAAYARVAVADFTRLARPEDWTSLLSNLQRRPDAAVACLAAMVSWRLAHDADHATATSMAPSPPSSTEEHRHG